MIVKVNIWMMDGSELKKVNIFKNKELGDSIVSTKFEIEELFENNRTVFFGGRFVQGGFIPEKIAEYEFVDDEHDMSIALTKFVKQNSGIYDINMPDVVSFVIDNRQDILKILK